MKYNHDEFVELIEVVEAQGGTLLDDPHAVKVTKHTTPRGEMTVRTSGCGAYSMFEVPVEGGKPAVLCAVCDNMGMMPRFLEARV